MEAGVIEDVSKRPLFEDGKIRIGLFRLSWRFIDKAIYENDRLARESLEMIFREIIPVRVESQHFKRVMEVTAYSALFDLVDEGSLAPEYVMLFTEEKDEFGVHHVSEMRVDRLPDPYDSARDDELNEFVDFYRGMYGGYIDEALIAWRKKKQEGT